jgi:hypothetical protein
MSDDYFMIEHQERLRASHDRLLEALREASEIIRTWHGMNIPKEMERAMWQTYQASPEMRRINAAIAAGEEALK